jgi:beta-phosphoglucomutase
LAVSEDIQGKMAAQKNDWYLEYIQRMDSSEILPGAAAYLESLRAKGIKTALGSASKNAPLILERLGISSLFDSVIDGNKVHLAKPDPEVFLRAASEVNIPPASCVVFEDAEAGVEAARRAGMGVVGIGKPAALKEADMVIAGLYQIEVISGG